VRFFLLSKLEKSHLSFTIYISRIKVQLEYHAIVGDDAYDLQALRTRWEEEPRVLHHRINHGVSHFTDLGPFIPLNEEDKITLVPILFIHK